jgi:hypothetical protein
VKSPGVSIAVCRRTGWSDRRQLEFPGDDN